MGRSSRTRLNPWGPGASAKERTANRRWRAVISIIRALQAARVFWSLEQPAASLLPGILQWRCTKPKLWQQICFDWCRYQRPWRKRTTLIGTAPWLPRLARVCRGDHAHTILEGFAGDPLTGKPRPRTDIASEYSPAFCKAYADAATDFFTGVQTDL